MSSFVYVAWCGLLYSAGSAVCVVEKADDGTSDDVITHTTQSGDVTSTTPQTTTPLTGGTIVIYNTNHINNPAIKYELLNITKLQLITAEASYNAFSAN